MKAQIHRHTCTVLFFFPMFCPWCRQTNCTDLRVTRVHGPGRARLHSIPWTASKWECVKAAQWLGEKQLEKTDPHVLARLKPLAASLWFPHTKNLTLMTNVSLPQNPFLLRRSRATVLWPHNTVSESKRAKFLNWWILNACEADLWEHSNVHSASDRPHSQQKS